MVLVITSDQSGAHSDRVQRLPAVAERLGVGKPTVRKWVRDGLFPRPRRLGPRAIGWLEGDIDAWLRGRPVVG